MERWRLSVNDIKNLIKQMQKPDVALDEEFNKLWMK